MFFINCLILKMFFSNLSNILNVMYRMYNIIYVNILIKTFILPTIFGRRLAVGENTICQECLKNYFKLSHNYHIHIMFIIIKKQFKKLSYIQLFINIV